MQKKYLAALILGLASMIVIYLINPLLFGPMFSIIFTIIGVTLIYRLFTLCDSFARFRAEVNEKLDRIAGKSGGA